MIPSIAGGLTNSGSMPISAGGGAAGSSGADASNSIGGIRNAPINFGGQSLMQNLPVLLLIAAGAYVVLKK